MRLKRLHSRRAGRHSAVVRVSRPYIFILAAASQSNTPLAFLLLVDSAEEADAGDDEGKESAEVEEAEDEGKRVEETWKLLRGLGAVTWKDEGEDKAEEAAEGVAGVTLCKGTKRVCQISSNSCLSACFCH